MAFFNVVNLLSSSPGTALHLQYRALRHNALKIAQQESSKPCKSKLKLHDCFKKKKKNSLKCPYYGLWKFIFWFWPVPNNRLTCMQGQKNTFIVLKYAFIFFLFCSPLPKGSFNDSFFQTPPLRDANLRWLVWWPSLLWLVFCVQHMSITERPSPLRPQLRGKQTQTAMVYALAQCRNALIKHCSLYTNILLYSLSELQIITTTNIHYSSTHF